MKMALSRRSGGKTDRRGHRPLPVQTDLWKSVRKHLQHIDPSTIRSRGDADRKLQAYVPDRRVRHFLLKNLVRNPTAAIPGG